MLLGLELHHTASAAANIRLHHNREAQTLRCRPCLRSAMNHPRLRVSQPQRLQHRKLRRLRQLAPESPHSIHHANATLLEMLQVPERVEDLISMSTIPRRGAHLVQN